jgi:hypothetical protein
MPFSSARPMGANADYGWDATGRQVMVSAVERATCASPMPEVTLLR